MRRFSVSSILLLLFCVCIASAQTPTPAAPATPPLLSPEAAYEQAGAPVDITRRDVNNWSDIETNALTFAVAEAKDGCMARTEQTFTGDDLIAYARLCDLGQQWAAVYKAATTYINSSDPAKPQLDQAYAFEVKAQLNLKNEKAALGAALAMLQAVPYGPLTDDVTSVTIRYMQFAFTDDALTLASSRQPFLLSLLRGQQLTAGTGRTTALAAQGASPLTGVPATPNIPLHTVFEHATAFAALEQYVNQMGLAATIMADIDRALPANLPPDEAIYIAGDRRQYALLGTHLPVLPGAVSLLPATETPPAQPRPGFVTVYLLFPPWCAQCIRQTQEIVPALVRTAIVSGSDERLHLYALLADTPPAALPPPVKTPLHASGGGAGAHHAAEQPTVTATISIGPPKATDQLRKTPTLVVAPSTLADFNASDFPFLIATDHNGIIRLMVPASPANALQQGGPVDQITDSIMEHWPPAIPPPPGGPSITSH